MHLVHLLIPLLCAMQAANAFVARGPSQLLGQRQLQRDYRVLFQEPPTLEKEAAKTEDAVAEKVAEPEEEMTETQKLMKQVKEAGTAGVISYALWELGFWALSVRTDFITESTVESDSLCTTNRIFKNEIAEVDDKNFSFVRP